MNPILADDYPDHVKALRARLHYIQENLAEAIAGVHTGDTKWQLPWHTHHLLLLTATPHMGKDYPYYALWRLLEPEILTTVEAFDQFAQNQRHKYFIRRTKEEMVRLDGKPLYPIGNWVQPFFRDDDVLRIIETQFSDPRRIAAILQKPGEGETE